MGTDCTIRIKDQKGKVLCRLWRLYDGYPLHIGKIIAEYLKDSELVEGFDNKMDNPRYFHGMGDLAASLISHLKNWKDPRYEIKHDEDEYIKTFYAAMNRTISKIQVDLPIDKGGACWDYTIYVGDKGQICLLVEGGEVDFNDDISKFNADEFDKANSYDEDDEDDE